MMPPSPVVLLAILMLGYPAAQIAAIMSRRPMRLRFNAAVHFMLHDPAVRPGDRGRIRQMMRWSRGGRETLRRFLRLPRNMLIQGYAEGRDPSKAPNPHRPFDPNAPVAERMESLRAVSVALEIASWPLLALVVIPIGVAAWLVGALAAKAQGGAGRIIPNRRDLVRVSVALHPSFN